VFFLPWKLHVLIVTSILLVFGTKESGAYLVTVFVLRVALLYYWLLFSLAGGSARTLLSIWRRAINFLFYFTPLGAEVPLPGAEKQHAVLRSIALYEGNICAGKTTMIRALATCARTVVHEENVPIDVLRRFNQSHDGVEIQMIMGRQRAESLYRSASKFASAHGITTIAHDRSVLGCRAFALWNYVSGTLPRDALLKYFTLVGTDVAGLLRQIDAPIVVYYLPVPAEICFARLRNRPGVDQSTTARYLLGVSLMHTLVITALLRDRPRNVSVVLTSSDAVTQPLSDNVCVCSHHTTSTVALDTFIGSLAFTPIEHARLTEVLVKWLRIPDMLPYCLSEREWTEHLCLDT